MSNSNAEQKLLDGSLWDDFCDELKAAGQLVKREGVPNDALIKAEGYRYLTRMLRAGLEGCLEFSDKDFPVLRCPVHETIKMGADNPDNYYQSGAINPAHDYKISGTRGTVDYLGFGTVINRYGSGGNMVTTGFVDAREMIIEADGSFEIIVSQTEQTGNWLPMNSQTNAINVRQTFQDRLSEKRAEITIERLNVDTDRPLPLSPEKLQRGLKSALQFVKGSTNLFEDWTESFLPISNQLPAADQDYCQEIGGDPNIFYFHSIWQLQPDEVLVLEAKTIPQCQTWNFQLDNWWMESLDYTNQRIHVNKHTAHYESDGSVKVYIAHTDPGHPNWIETAGHTQGTMCWRWIRAEQHPPVEAKVVKLADLDFDH